MRELQYTRFSFVAIHRDGPIPISGVYFEKIYNEEGEDHSAFRCVNMSVFVSHE